MKTIDKDVLARYNAGIEKNRLHTDLGLIEFQRTKEILRQTLPPAPAVIYDSVMGLSTHLLTISRKGE